MRKNLRLIIVLIVLLMEGRNAVAQGLTDPPVFGKLDNNMTAHTPDVEAMTKYTSVPVSLYTGLPQVSIPIYELKTKNLNVPVALGYNYNGNRPNEVAGTVGLGWNVQGGGVITRIVKGKIDHGVVSVEGNNYDDYANIGDLAWKQEVLVKMVENQGLDGEPDLYVFNCNGLSGKFIMVKGKAYLFPHQNIRIEQIAGYFVITNEKGDRYIFQDTEVTDARKATPNTPMVPSYTSAWHISKIISADLSDTVYYQYHSYRFRAPISYVENYSLKTSTHAGMNGDDVQSYSLSNVTTDAVSGKLMSSIRYRNTVVSFTEHDGPRGDCFNEVIAAPMLDSVTVSYGGRRIKQFNLIHNYVNNKLSLKEVDIVGAMDVQDSYGNFHAVTDNNVQKYLMQYDGDAAETAYFIDFAKEKGLDKYGYYNGAFNQSLFTSDDIVTGAPLQYILGSSRKPMLEKCRIGVLNKIIYPTGGTTAFDYELNQQGHFFVSDTYTDVHDEHLVLYTPPNIHDPNRDPNEPSGQPVDSSYRIVLYKPQTITVYYSYPLFRGNDKIAVQKTPVVTISDGTRLVYTSPIDQSAQRDGTALLDLPAGTYYLNVHCEAVNGGTNGASAMASIDYKAYTYASAYDDAPGIRVSNIKFYDNVDQTKPALSKHYDYNYSVCSYQNPVKVSNVTVHGDLCSPPFSGNACNDPLPKDRDERTFQTGPSSPLSDMLNNPFYYKYVTETDVDTNGPKGKTEYVFDSYDESDPDIYLKKKTEYSYKDGSYIALTQTENQYELIEKMAFASFSAELTDLAESPTGCYSCAELEPSLYDPTSTAGTLRKVYSAGGLIETRVSAYKRMKQSVATVWDENGAQPVSNTTKYYYDNPDHIYPTRVETQNTKGETITAYMKYALDYTASGCATLTSLQNDFLTAKGTAMTNYNNCFSSLVNALQPYQPYSTNAAGRASFQNLLNTYNCENNYKTASAAVFSNRDAAWTNYLGCLTNAQTASSVPWMQSVYWMQKNNMVSPVIETYTTVQTGGNEYVLSASRNEYAVQTTGSVPKLTGMKQVEVKGQLLKSSFLANTDNYYKDQVKIDYNTDMNIISQKKSNDISQNYLWGYNGQYAVAEVIGSDAATLAGLINQSVLDNPASPSALNTELNKIRTGLATTNALVSTNTFLPATGVVTKTDPAGRTAYYEYDAFGRLQSVRNQDRNIVKQYCYTLSGQPTDCAGNTTYYNTVKQQMFTKTGCPVGSIGQSLIYTVQANVFTSLLNQGDADTKAQADINANGQNYVNAHTSCVFSSAAQAGSYLRNSCPVGTKPLDYMASSMDAGAYTSTVSQADADAKALAALNGIGQLKANTYSLCYYSNQVQSQVFTKNNCGQGGVGSGVTYTVNADVYHHLMDQDKANKLALDDIAANGQNYANANGYCTFYNVLKQQTFTKNNCASGGTGSAVVYTVNANAYSSTISQTDADNKAQNEINANGQNYANANGYCTFYNALRQQAFTKNNCAAGGTPSNVTYTVNANTYSSTISQADADTKAQNDINTNGQNYANANGYCAFYNVLKQQTFTKNNCAAGGNPSSVTYTVNAGAYNSTISQADADSKAQNEINANGQNYANANGYCTFYNTVRSQTFTKNDCASGGYPNGVTYTVGANVYNSTISQADADAKAQNEINIYGQGYANANGYCTFYNSARSQTFTKNDCAAGGTPSSVTYNVYASAYSSTISQADADAKAQNEINIYGQGYANANGYCVFYNVLKQQTFTKNNCASGGTGSAVTYTVNAGSYSSTISQADADSKAQNEINANGQGFANAGGYCLFYNVEKAQSFLKNDCPTGGQPSTDVYRVYAGTYSSTISQADADSKAQNDINANGQAYVNAHAVCTFNNVAKSGVFTRNNCPAGYTATSVTYVIYAGTYSSMISQADADAQAQAAVNANGQAYANANGQCNPPSCSCGDAERCINGQCEPGVIVYTDSVQIGPKQWICTYHFEWSDGFWSQDYTHNSRGDCMGL